MSTRINGILYTRIGTTFTARAGNGSSFFPNAVASSFAGHAIVLPRVEFAGIVCKVVELGYRSFCNVNGITNLTIPNTVTTLKEGCIEKMPNLKIVIIPSSVTTVESWFIVNMVPDQIIFCGTKEPKAVYTYSNEYVASGYNKAVIVPLNYEPGKTSFLNKNAERRSISCPSMKYNTRKMKYHTFVSSNFLIIMILIGK